MLVHDPQPDLGERVLGDGELYDADDLVPVGRVEPGPHGHLGDRRPFRGQPEEPGGLGVDGDLPVCVVPAPHAGRKGGQYVPYGGQGLTSAH